MCEKAELAKAYFEEGYNCAQAVLLAFADECGLEKAQAAKVASSFGGGMGRMREVCGAVSGMLLALGMIDGYADPHAKEEKAAQYARVQAMAGAFRDKAGSMICRELLSFQADTSPLPEARTEAYYHSRPCGDLVALAAKIAEAEFVK